MTTVRASNTSRRALVCLAIALALHAVLALAVGTVVIRSAGSDIGYSFDDVVVAFDDIPTRKERTRFVPPTNSDLPQLDEATGGANEISDSLAHRLDAPPPSMAGRLADRVREGYSTGGLPTTAANEANAENRDVSFAGMKVRHAASVAYVVDASGSLIGTLPVVLEELRRSLERLSPGQQFGVVFFQRNHAVVAPGANGMRDANAKVINDELDWINANVRPAGRSNPLEALETALAWKPDVIFFLATSITGSGDFEVGHDEVLARLEELNPLNANGGRRTRIQCIQFLDPDPLDTLRQIAVRHGGADGYRFLTRHELGLNRAPPSAVPPGPKR